ncbi:hypothetical protein GW17_00023169 [Ensete ventricosum]|nr:hypothetical protein GW17_00023169 [Ensete ventricosum]
MPIRQRSYGRPDTGKADTSTCGRITHRKDRGRGGSVRRQGKPQGRPGCQAQEQRKGGDNDEDWGERGGGGAVGLMG